MSSDRPTALLTSEAAMALVTPAHPQRGAGYGREAGLRLGEGGTVVREYRWGR